MCCNSFITFQSSLGNLLRLRVRLADRLFAIHKLHANYGRVFSEWSALEKTMGDGLQVTIVFKDCSVKILLKHYFPHNRKLGITWIVTLLQLMHTWKRKI